MRYNTKMSREIGTYFDDIAAEYDERVKQIGGRWNEPLANALERLQLDPATVLDLASGTGQTIETVRAHTDPQEITAVDISPSMLSIVERKHQAGRARLLLANKAIDQFLHETDDRYDLITSVAGFHFLPDALHTITSASQRLNPEGYVMFTYSPLVLGSATHGERKDEDNGITSYQLHAHEIMNTLDKASLRLDEHSLFQWKESNPDVGGFVVAQLAD